ncbi:MAG: TerB family tellurite resistance protein [Myxococcales bacterium]|nr:TerB family tellurite resistance protein [Myxococcales bacterium]
MDDTQRQERTRVLGPSVPADLAAGAKALKSNRDAPTDPQAARLHALLEVAYLAAAADDDLSEHEIDHLVANLHAWLGHELEARFLVELFDHLAQQLAREGFQGRLAELAKVLDAPSRRDAYKLACVTALCDHEVHDDELAFLGGIADAFGIPADEAQGIFDALDEAVGAI